MTDSSQPPVESGVLDQMLIEVMRRTDTAIGGLYLLVPETGIMHLTVLRGAPAEFFGPWLRTPITAPIPVAEAVRTNRVVSVTGQEEMARRFPRVALVLPYPFSVLAAPLTGTTRCWGGVFLVWSAEQPPKFIRRERSHVASAARRMAEAIEDAVRAGLPVVPPERPRILSGAEELVPTSAADFAERLPGGCAALDLEGRFTYVSGSAASLLGRGADQLVGTTPWHSLRWLDDPVYEDQYRAAVFSRKPVAMTAYRPPDHWLRFVLYPDDTGISIRVHRETADVADPLPDPPGPPPDAGPPRRAGQLYRLMHLATVLTEAVSVADVVDRVADEILPAFGAEGLIVYHLEDGRQRIAGHRGYDWDYLRRFEDISFDTVNEPGVQTLVSGVPV
ncbi:MAG TPA: PAS domain-containing protein, partial [Yinghuangia sp.]|nr:PAS domain-containing protein [Yinghuangia sp.]